MPGSIIQEFGGILDLLGEQVTDVFPGGPGNK